MNSAALSERTRMLVRAVSDAVQRQEAEAWLVEECGATLSGSDGSGTERIQIAALKLSEGSIDKLIDAIVLARTDWRDVLVDAGFGDDIHAHEKWTP